MTDTINNPEELPKNNESTTMNIIRTIPIIKYTAIIVTNLRIISPNLKLFFLIFSLFSSSISISRPAFFRIITATN